MLTKERNLFMLPLHHVPMHNSLYQPHMHDLVDTGTSVKLLRAVGDRNRVSEYVTPTVSCGSCARNVELPISDGSISKVVAY